MVRVGDKNAFGMKVRAIDGRFLDLECAVCKTVGSVLASEFNSTRCGSATCGSTQGRNE
jgi:hypothetical protein